MTNRIAITSALTLLLMGCSNTAEEVTADVAPFEGQSFTIHVPETAGLAPVLEPMVEEWNARTGGNATMVEYSDSVGAGFSAGDAVVVSMAEASSLAARLAEIPEGTPGREELNWNQQLRALRERVSNRGREPRLVPISCPALLCYYRKDLLDAAQLEPPTTWPEYNKLLMTVEDWAPGLKAVEPWAAEFRLSMFTARSIAYASPRDSLSLFFDLDTGAPRLSTPGFVKAAEDFKAVSSQLADCWEMTPAQCRAALLNGQAAIGLTFEPSMLPPEIERGDNVRLGFCRLPGSTEVYSQSLREWSSERPTQPGFAGFDGYAAAVIGGADEEATGAAFNLVSAVVGETNASLSSPIRGLTAIWHTAVAPQLFEPQLTIDEATDYVQATAKTLQETHLILDMPVSNRKAFIDSFAATVTADAIANRPVADVLADVNTAWASIIDGVGAMEFVNDYRCNIGVRGKE